MSAKKSALLIYAGAAVALVCFFLPWISINVMGFGFSVTGMQIASGGGTEMASLGGALGASVLVYLFPAVAVLSVVVLLLGAKQMGAKNTALAEVVMGGVAVAYWAYLTFTWNSEFSKSIADAASLGIKMSFWNVLGLGFWGTAVGSVLIVVGGVLMMKEGGSQPAKPSEPAQPAA